MEANVRKTLCFAIVGGALLAGCGGGGEEEGSSTDAAATDAVAIDAVAIKDYLYEPADFTVAKGTTVTFSNGDDTSHTATADDSKAFDSGTIAGGKSGMVSFDSPGTFSYYCRFHPFMEGSVTVSP